MKKKRLSLIASIAILSVLTVSTAISLCTIISSEAASKSIDESSYVLGTNEGHLYKCYNINADDTAVAIEWYYQAIVDSTKDDYNPMPADLTVTSTITLEGGGTKTIKAIAKHGFRYGTMSTITLPSTIEDIKEEAFAYCENLTEFTFPYQITKVEKSTFLDCRSLTNLFYSDSTGAKKLGNSTITEFGNHAFDSCVSLQNFYCPSSARYFRESCFQKCESLTKFYFPSNTGSNSITIESYAFGDCLRLESIYFEENLTTVEKYAFSNSNLEGLVLTYYYTTEDTPSFDTHWRDRRLTMSDSSEYRLEPVDQVFQSMDYPGLVYSVQNAKIKLDSAYTNPTYVTDLETGVLDQDPEEKTTSPYIVVESFSAPYATQAGYYQITKNAQGTVTDRVLTIPNNIEIDGVVYPVKVIGDNAFAGDCGAWKVIFNSNLVQIRHRAFYHNTSLYYLDFSSCVNLKEISYELFDYPGTGCPSKDDQKGGTENANQLYNTSMTSLTLPSCLEYIGDSAFYNFKNLVDGVEFLKDGTGQSHLKVIGDFAFAVKNHDYTPSKTIEIEVPNSLNDDAASKANYYHFYLPYYTRTNRRNRYAIGVYAFENCRYMSSFRMQAATAAQKLLNDYTTSLASNLFVRNPNLIRVETNYNCYLVGKDLFKRSDNIKEVFLHSEKADLGSIAMPWGLNDYDEKFGETLLSMDENKQRPDVVIYVSGTSAPKDLDNPNASGYSSSKNKLLWNSDQSNTYSNGLNSGGRSLAPTHYDVDWDSADGIIYWNPQEDELVSRPTKAGDYNVGIISLVKNNTTSNYSVGRYYTDGIDNDSTGVHHQTNTIDLTNIPDFSGTITKIGDCAFATTGNTKAGVYFILPNSIEEIGERAFFRGSSQKTYAVRIITYKDGSGNPVVAANENRTYSQIVSATNNGNSYGYCCLPNNVEKIERNAFYNNLFKNVELSSKLNFLGNAAFHVHRDGASQITGINFTPASGSPFSLINNGIYYTGGDHVKTLLYQTAGGNFTGSTTERTLTIDDDTIAIGPRACTNNEYTSIELNDGLTTIYGSAFQNSKDLTTITGDGMQTLKYICSDAISPDTEAVTVDPDDDAFDMADYRLEYGATGTTKAYSETNLASFKNCTNLKTVDFTQMDSLKKIGKNAFDSCTNLDTVTFQGTASPLVPADTYSFYKGTPSTKVAFETGSTNLTTGVIDFSRDKMPSLMSIASNAFASCSKIKFVILPNTTGNDHTAESQFSYAKEGGDGNVFPRSTTVILCGETYKQADYNVNLTNCRKHYNINTNITTDKVYYRYYYDKNPLDYTYGSENFVEKYNYWTLYNGEYYLFNGRSQVVAFYNEVNGI